MTIISRERGVWLATHVYKHEAELRSWLSRWSLRGLEIDDIVQESYAVLAGLQSVAHIRSPRIYMFEVAKSVILQALRRAPLVSFDAIAELDGLQIPDDSPTAEAIVAGRQELSRLAVLIDELPPKCREAFVLRRVRGLCQRDVAKEMGVSENTIEKHVGKALAILTSAIGRGGNRCLPPSKAHDESDSYRIKPSRDRKGH